MFRGGSLVRRIASFKNPVSKPFIDHFSLFLIDLPSTKRWLWLQQMGLSKQGQHAIKKVRQVENEARQNRLAQLGLGSGDLSEPLLNRKQ